MHNKFDVYLNAAIRSGETENLSGLIRVAKGTDLSMFKVNSIVSSGIYTFNGLSVEQLLVIAELPEVTRISKSKMLRLC